RFSRDWSSDVCSSDLEVRGFLLGVEDRQRRNAEHLIATRTTHRVNAGKAAAIPHGLLRRVSAGPHIFGYLQLALSLHQLIEEWQIGRASCRDREGGGG